MLKLGLAGFGYWGAKWARVLHTMGNEGIALTDICDNNTYQLDHARSLYPDVCLHDSYESLLATAQLDGVILAVPTSIHFPYAMQSLAQSIPTLIEKPVAMSALEAIRMGHVARQQKTIMMAGHTYLYHPAIVELKSLMQGRPVRWAESRRLSYGRFINDGVCVSLVLGPHDISIFNFLLGSLPDSVQAWGTRSLSFMGGYDVCKIWLQYPNDVMVSVSLSRLYPKRVRWVQIGLPDVSIVFDDSWDSSLHELRYPDNIADTSKNVHYRHIPNVEPLLMEARAFAQAISSGEEPPYGVDHAVGVMRVLDAVRESLELCGEKVQVG